MQKHETFKKYKRIFEEILKRSSMNTSFKYSHSELNKFRINDLNESESMTQIKK